MARRYNPQEIAAKWQARWAQDRLYEVDEAADGRPKFFALTMFPYTSGDLHIGHWYAMAPSDTQARFMRMQGHKVLHPIGFDAFGLPAENAAIKRGIHPKEWTYQNIERMRGQLRTLGASYDWRREGVTCDPAYYRWNQWFFLKLFEAGLAYRALAPANWCPSCQTTLANEQVVGGACERCETPVTHKDLEQWFLRITRYADELLDTSHLDWPEKILTMQANWIGRSEGVEVAFDISQHGLPEKEIRVFTTRPDTIFGVTFMVLAPEHPLVAKLTSPDRRAAVERYVEEARRETEIERLSTEREKSGVFTGAQALNRLSGERVPIWIADYVLLSYGTGAVMGVPAHDERDFAFAKRHGLPIKTVIAPPNWAGQPLQQAYVEPGAMVNSGQFDGLSSEEGAQRIARRIEEQGWGRRTVSYRIRDWLISRQRYWGAPIPIVHCPHCGPVGVPEDQLPVLLPDDVDFRPTGESPLKLHRGFVNIACPRCERPAQRETDTMDTFVDSSWYHLRYTSPGYDQGPFDPARYRYWMPVDLYTGGAEHAVMHLLYARFFHKALRDLGIVEGPEPYLKLFNQGTITKDGAKMSKSRGNVVNPDDFVALYGADAVRLYLMFVGPWDQGGDWSDAAIRGMPRFLERVWDLYEAASAASAPQPDPAREAGLVRLLHKTTQRVTEDLQTFRFNTAIAALMEMANALGDVPAGTPQWQAAFDRLLLLLAPLAPHIAEELWSLRGRPYSIHTKPWPSFDPALTIEAQVTLVVQVNGRVRDKLAVAPDITQERARELALSSERVRQHTGGRAPTKVIYVPGKLINLVL